MDDRYLEFFSNHYLLALALALVTYLLIQEFFDVTLNKKFQSLSPLLTVAKMNETESVVIDVREPHEFIQNHIENAINAPLSKLHEHLAKLSKHKKECVFLACENGVRSASASKILAKAGFEQLFVITGGMQSWENDYKLPIKKTAKNKIER